MKKIIKSIKIEEIKRSLTIGERYIYTVVRETDKWAKKEPQREERIVTCIGIYPHHARFDFGKYTRSLTWFDVGKEIREV